MYRIADSSGAHNCKQRVKNSDGRGRSRGAADKPKKIGVNPLYPRHPRSMNQYIHLITALITALI
jgi:hypothetical protein